ncbi:MAG: TonB-dependent receptor plug domain-containing protein [Opitutae bacterium]|nr:TonB-dependent receptor plug domain-containing protein [Opitutae bacterium]
MIPQPRLTLRAVLLAGCSLLGVWPTSAWAQSADPDPEEKVIALSPFKVSADKDKGYRATNSVSGSRLDTPIKEIPMPIEVITEKFLRDTGARDLRESLRYSAGILLQSQNDYGTPGGAYQGPGGVNNAEGSTANPSRTSIKLRGFVTESVLRDGYLRLNATDSVNIARIEVVRGPAALLYGVGNFGGIVNYLPKLPEARARAEFGLGVGTYGFRRSTLDVTGPLAKKWEFNYRLTGAYEQADDYTQYRQGSHHFLSPVITFKPTETTEVLVDYEDGIAHDAGIGFQRVRSSVGPGVNNDQNEHADFYTLPGTDPRTFRWSGPDTYLNSHATNLRLQVSQHIGENIDFIAGYNRSRVRSAKRDVQGNFQPWTDQFANPDSAFSDVLVQTIDPANGDASGGLGNQSGYSRATLAYRWVGEQSETARDQVRAEATYRLKLFEGAAWKWAQMDNTLLVGHTEMRADVHKTNSQTAWNQANDNFWVTNYHNPSNYGPFRFGQAQANGTPEMPVLPYNGQDTTSWNQGSYAVYQGKLLHNRVTLIGGVRRDRNETEVTVKQIIGMPSSTTTRRPTTTQTTTQLGATFAVSRALSVYVLESQGLQPNLDGKRDVNGVPLPATMAKSREAGLKVDLVDGRISGTVSAFKIRRTDAPMFYWWAPTSNRSDRFNPNKDIVYRVTDLQPPSLGGAQVNNGAAEAALAQWNAGLAAGSIYKIGMQWYVNASQPTGAELLDTVFDYTKAHNYTMPGWIYEPDANTNNTFPTRASGNGGDEFVIGTDNSTGWDAQLLFAPNDHLQFLLSYAHVTREVEFPGHFAKSPYPQDRWAPWYFPNSDWGLTRVPLDQAYGDPADTSTWNGINWGKGLPMDDTPEHHFAMWASYNFTTGLAKGLTLGAGGYYESPRLYVSGLTHGGGQQITDKNGKNVMLETRSRTNVDLMVRYGFKLSGRDASVQLNVNNVLNDQKRYGFVYAAPTTARLEFSCKL